ncbi:hypothetical protein DSO57_1037005 [Entomophthora muscae]|uniref:Uncharacterized protein n=1 Tax=Entomophthora muscae TaxID=34485 RepID=A0ACC2SNE6_9FUNG|nr:hypothetical protein DSO57_1037005 [Entomophthora muscae]
MNLIALAGLLLLGVQGEFQVVSVDGPKVVLYGDKAELMVTLGLDPEFNGTFSYEVVESGVGVRSQGSLIPTNETDVQLSGEVHTGYSMQGYKIEDIELTNTITRELQITISSGGFNQSSSVEIHGMPGAVTMLPIVMLLLVAVVSSQALVALALGLFLASTFINGFNPLLGFLRMMDHYAVSAVADPGNAQVILFTFYLSGLVALIQKSGGAHGMAKLMTKIATDRWRGQWATLLAGVLIFFDDFASCLIVGSNMQPVTDALLLSREKLAFLVHATSSPPASIAPISSWIGFELTLIKKQMDNLKIPGEPFMVFLFSRFYPLYMLLFIVALLLLKRDFGPMLDAERRAIYEKRLVKDDAVLLGDAEDPLTPDPKTPQRWFNAVVPVVFVIFTTVTAMFVGGYYVQKASENPDYSPQGLASKGNSAEALLYGSFLGSIISMTLFRAQGLMGFKMLIAVYIHGVKEIAEPLLILILAWSIGSAFSDLKAADFIVSAMSSTVNPGSLPTFIFIISCIISFTTGTSWGTMSIMFPLVIPLVNTAAPSDHNIFVHSVSSILTGAIFGDQCSPISGTSILSAMSSKCPLKDHVTTQLPYALLVSAVSILFGYLPVGYGIYPTWAALVIGSLALGLCLYLLGTKTESQDPSKWRRLMRTFGKSPHSPDPSHIDLELNAPAPKKI